MRRASAAMLLAIAACKSTTPYAVYASYGEMNADAGCFRACQVTRSGGERGYIGCLRTCPTVVIREDTTCDENGAISGATCMDESVSRVSAGKTVWLIIGLVGGAAVLAGGAR